MGNRTVKGSVTEISYCHNLSYNSHHSFHLPGATSTVPH